MGDKIWYTLDNSKTYTSIEGVVLVTDSNSRLYINEIKESIDAFNKEVEWEDMWDLEEAGKRFTTGNMLFLLRDKEGALGHMWSDSGYLYNVFISKRRKQGLGVKFVQHCLNFIEEKELVVYCDKWNSKAQKFTEKIGFIKR